MTATNDKTWNPYTQPVDKFTLGGKLSPGLCEVSGADAPRRWDELDGYGLSGARLRYKGLKLAHFSISIRLYTPEDWADWYAFKPITEKAPLGHFAKSLDIFHPHLFDLGIASAVIENVSQPTQTADGEWTIEIKFIEYRTPKVTIGTPDGAVATEADPIQALIGQLLEQRDKLAAKADAP